MSDGFSLPPRFQQRLIEHVRTAERLRSIREAVLFTSNLVQRIDHVVAVVSNFEMVRPMWIEVACPVVYDGTMATSCAAWLCAVTLLTLAAPPRCAPVFLE